MTLPATIERGATGPQVRWLQYCLTRLTLQDTDIDGVFGPHTQDGVREFQASAGLAVDGVVGPRTWTALRGGDPEPPTLTEGSTGPVVSAVQTTLNEGRGDITAAGEPVLVVDGVFGPRTAQVVTSAQQVGGIGQDGVVGLATWALPLHAAGQVLADVCGVRPPGEQV